MPSTYNGNAAQRPAYKATSHKGKARLTPLPFYLSLPTILTLPVVETSKATIAFYVKSALDTKAGSKKLISVSLGLQL